MEPDEVQILVHIGASCSPSDDTRYREEARGFLNWIHQGDSRRIPSQPALEHDGRMTCSRTGLAGQEVTVNQGIAVEAEQRSPAPQQMVQVGRTPAERQKRTPLQRSKTAPAIIKETPLVQVRPVQPVKFKTPPSTVEDSQPSHSSFKRAFIEAASLSSGSYKALARPQARWKRARTESPRGPSGGSRETKRVCSSSHSLIPSSPPIRAALSFGLDGVSERARADSSPSPPKRSQAGLKHLQRTHDSTTQGVVEQEPHSPSKLQGPIYEDEQRAHANEQVSSSAASDSPPDSTPLQSSVSSHNRQKANEPPPSQCDSDASITLKESTLTLAYAQRQCLLRELPAPELLITAPPPPTGSAAFRTHLTSALSIIRERLQPLSKYYAPVRQIRAVRPLERGFWQLTLPAHWVHQQRAAFWRRLRDHVARGKAGFGTRLERILDGQDIGCSQGREAAFRPADVGRETWRIWCWGEVHVEIWLLLYVDSEKAVKDLRMEWCDGVAKAVVCM